MARGCRWLVAVVLLACCAALVGCSSPTTQPNKPAEPDKDKVNKPSGEIG
jgi:hypothetical protein